MMIQFGKQTVGKGIGINDVTEFYYTYASSTFPPQYQRYRFFMEGGKRYFYHEKREGNVFPLTEAHITVSGTAELTETDWKRFFGFLEGGTVKKREENVTSGDAGPWLYLYWNGDNGCVQEFSFASYGKLSEFEAYCAELCNGTPLGKRFTVINKNQGR